MPARKSTTTDPSATPPAKKTPAKKAPAKKTATRKVPAKATATEPSPPRPTRDQIAHAAYLIYRRRSVLGLPGDPATDWVEAERQLREPV